ncbi:MAG TPA: efflux RND transporter periplasmic adaptor subunit [Burkholderiales bacterium]|nr:efflux RND transporter periplasmic adaptor subunit [Burkholderiales bacterium]
MKKFLIFVTIIVLIGGGLLLHRGHKKNKGETNDYILLNKSDIVIVKRGNVNNVVAFTGDLSPLNQVVISSQLDAQVLKVLVSEGQYVNKGQVLAVLDNSEIKQIVNRQEALLNSAKVKLALSKNTLDKNKELLDQGFISKLGYDKLQTDYEDALLTVKQEQAVFYQNQKQLSETVVTAPFSGYVYQKNIDSGQVASKNSKLFSLANLDIMQIKAAIPSEQINSIKVNQPVSFEVETNNQKYQGKITRINHVAEIGTRSYLIYIEFDNRNYKLNAGQFVKGQIILDSLVNVLYIPSNAIHNSTDTNKSYVWFLANGNIIEKPIEIILKDAIDKLSAITGLSENDEILSGEVISIKPGQKIKVVD